MADRVIAERYRLEERLGHGGMSEVWAAEDTELERRVAIKLIGRDADPERFEREARAAAALSHPNICGLYDYGTTDDGRPFMVLECLDGTLEERLTPGVALPDADTERIARDVAAGLAHAHARGVLHRDLKPGNILFDSEGRAKIGDLGIARMSGAGTLTEVGTVLGTAAYISPEQARGESASPASDVYSFGVLLYRMLTGRLPFEADEPLALAALHANADPPTIAHVRPDAPPALESVAMRSLAKDPAQRPPDGAALAAELGPSLTAPTVIADPQPTIVRGAPPVPPPAGGRGWRAAAIVAGALLLAGGGVAAAYLATEGDAGTGEATTGARLSVSVPKRQTQTVATEATEPATTTEPTTSKRTTTRKRPATTATPPPTTPTEPAFTGTVETTVPTETLPVEPPPPPATTETLPATTETTPTQPDPEQ